MLPLIVGALEDHTQPKPPTASETEDFASTIVEAEIVSDKENATPEKRKPDFASQMAEISDDMDGILGDINTVPQTERS